MSDGKRNNNIAHNAIICIIHRTTDMIYRCLVSGIPQDIICQACSRRGDESAGVVEGG